MYIYSFSVLYWTALYHHGDIARNVTFSNMNQSNDQTTEQQSEL